MIIPEKQCLWTYFLCCNRIQTNQRWLKLERKSYSNIHGFRINTSYSYITSYYCLNNVSNLVEVSISQAGQFEFCKKCVFAHSKQNISIYLKWRKFITRTRRPTYFVTLFKLCSAFEVVTQQRKINKTHNWNWFPKY